MNSILPWLFIGSYRDTLNRSLLDRHRIGAMLLLAEHVHQPAITSVYLAVEDGEPLSEILLRRGVDFVLSMHREHQHVLIACGAGISRSAIFATAVVKEVEGRSLLEAMKVVKHHHPQASPHMALWESVCAYYHEEVPFMALLHLLNGQQSENR
jgi:protein-tyrosine phosphatase